MKIISEAIEGILNILAKFKKKADRNRLLHYVVTEQVEDGYLLYNLLTRELLLLSEEEYKNLTELDYLKDHFFLVPENTNEKELADFVRLVLTTRKRKSKNITSYTIFTTTDCNARCFYCYELGRSRIPMTEDTAHQVAKFIQAHCAGEKVRIQWYGGEPLYNQSVIDIICADLRELGVEYFSTAISNGYLFDQTTVNKAVADWKLEKVQIPLDGTEAVYNKAKAYIYKNINCYQTVQENISRLLDAGIEVTIRMNLSLYNAEDLVKLVYELADRFAGCERFRVYADYIFEVDTPLAESYSLEQWILREKAMSKLEEAIEQTGLGGHSGIRKKYRVNYCMADSGKAVTITPTGNIGLCDHYSESEFIGHINKEGFDNTVIQSWKQTEPEIPECAECFYFPECVRLKKCAYRRVCFAELRNGYLRKTKRSMCNEYEKWQNKTQSEESVEDDIC